VQSTLTNPAPDLALDLANPEDDARSSKKEELPFTLAELKSAIPSEFFVPSVARSLAYFFWDIFVVAALYVAAIQLDAWWFYPFFWLATGTMGWALFVVGHDCGHGSFSRIKWLNNLIGHITHTLILVPFHGWRISHRTHHANTGNIDTDESWYPTTESTYRAMKWYEKFLRFEALLILYPLYLFKRSPSRETGSHFDPGSPLFKKSERNDVITSTICCVAMLAFLGLVGFQFGLWALVKFYVIPYVIFVMWLDLVTFLHHSEADIPWYRGKDWYFLKGALSTIDRSYGFIDEIHHNIGTHVAHHIFIGIPHYNLKAATESLKPVLGKYYRISHEPIWRSLLVSKEACHYAPDQGGTVYYQPKEEANLKSA
jgi:acyl-lipid omega-3 desaturase